MKKIFFPLLLLFTSFHFSFAQNRVEIYVNGNVQPISDESINVYSPDDKIEIRIYYGNDEKKSVVESLKGEGCGIERKEKNRITIIPPGPQEQRSTKRIVERQHKTHFVRFPDSKEGYVCFSFFVNELHACQGEDFEVEFSVSSKLSKLNSYKDFRKSYKFFYSI